MTPDDIAKHLERAKQRTARSEGEDALLDRLLIALEDTPPLDRLMVLTSLLVSESVDLGKGDRDTSRLFLEASFEHADGIFKAYLDQIAAPPGVRPS